MPSETMQLGNCTLRGYESRLGTVYFYTGDGEKLIATGDLFDAHVLAYIPRINAAFAYTESGTSGCLAKRLPNVRVWLTLADGPELCQSMDEYILWALDKMTREPPAFCTGGKKP